MALTPGEIGGFVQAPVAPSSGIAAAMTGAQGLGEGLFRREQINQKREDQARQRLKLEHDMFDTQRKFDEGVRSTRETEQMKRLEEATRRRRLASSSMEEAIPLLQSGDPHNMNLARALLQASGVEVGRSERHMPGHSTPRWGDVASGEVIDPFSGLPAPHPEDYEEIFEFTYQGKPLGELSVDEVRNAQLDRSAELGGTLEDTAGPLEKDAARQAAELIPELLKVFKGDEVKAVQEARKIMDSRLKNESAERRARTMAMSQRAAMGRGSRRDRRDDLKFFQSEVKRMGIEDMRSNLGRMDLIRGQLTGNGQDQMNALVAIRDARESGIMTKDDFDRSFGLLGFEDKLGAWISMARGDGLSDEIVAGLLGSLEKVEEMWNDRLENGWQTMDAYRNDAQSDSELGAAETIMRAVFVGTPLESRLKTLPKRRVSGGRNNEGRSSSTSFRTRGMSPEEHRDAQELMLPSTDSAADALMDEL